MRQRPAVELLESRDLPSGSAGLVGLPRLDVPMAWHQARVRSLPPERVASVGSTSQRWDRLLVGTWYVPAANLLAYVVGPAGARPVPIADQTFFHIRSARDGFFSGESEVRLSRPTVLGWLRPEPMRFTMTGVVTPQGRVRITFTPTDPGQPPVTGVGTMQFVDGSWRMTMQVATGSAPYVIHWAYMTKVTPGVTPPGSRGALRSGEWRWLLGTRWALADSELFGTRAGLRRAQRAGVFEIEGYRNGYFWGRGLGRTPFSVVGSVTPEGNLFLVLTAADGESASRTGSLQHTVGGRVMRFRSYTGSPAAGWAGLRNSAGSDAFGFRDRAAAPPGPGRPAGPSPAPSASPPAPTPAWAAPSPWTTSSGRPGSRT